MLWDEEKIEPKDKRYDHNKGCQRVPYGSASPRGSNVELLLGRIYAQNGAVLFACRTMAAPIRFADPE